MADLTVPDLSNVLSVLPAEVRSSLDWLVVVVKVVGIALIIYVIYLIIASVINIRRYQRIKRIEDKVNEIDKKLNYLLNRKERKHYHHVKKKRK